MSVCANELEEPIDFPSDCNLEHVLGSSCSYFYPQAGFSSSKKSQIIRYLNWSNSYENVIYQFGLWFIWTSLRPHDFFSYTMTLRLNRFYDKSLGNLALLSMQYPMTSFVQRVTRLQEVRGIPFKHPNLLMRFAHSSIQTFPNAFCFKCS